MTLFPLCIPQFRFMFLLLSRYSNLIDFSYSTPLHVPERSTVNSPRCSQAEVASIFIVFCVSYLYLFFLYDPYFQRVCFSGAGPGTVCFQIYVINCRRRSVFLGALGVNGLDIIPIFYSWLRTNCKSVVCLSLSFIT